MCVCASVLVVASPRLRQFSQQPPLTIFFVNYAYFGLAPRLSRRCFYFVYKNCRWFLFSFSFFLSSFFSTFLFPLLAAVSPVLPPVTLICGADWWAAQAAGDVLLGLLFFLLFLLAGLKGRINWLIMKWGAYGKCKVIEFG